MRSLHIDVGVDPDHTDVTVSTTGTDADGTHHGTVTVITW